VKQVKTYAAAHTRTHCPGCGRGVLFPVKFVIAECTQCGHKFSLCQECGEPIGRQEVFCKACRVTLNRGEACT
jgi:uncharacterized protein (DUF983 family)